MIHPSIHPVLPQIHSPTQSHTKNESTLNYTPKPPPPPNPAPGGVKARFHVGDTPMDMQAALEKGVTPIGVVTGIYSRESLLSVAPGATVLDDLSDTPRFLSLLGL